MLPSTVNFSAALRRRIWRRDSSGVGTVGRSVIHSLRVSRPGPSCATVEGGEMCGRMMHSHICFLSAEFCVFTLFIIKK
jgi:hypothetical protein